MAASPLEYRLKEVAVPGRGPVPIVLQDVNGSCGLIVIANILLFRGQIRLRAGRPTVSFEELVGLLGDHLLGQSPTDVAPETSSDGQANLDAILPLIPVLQRGIDVNTRFSGPAAFEVSRELLLFDAFAIRLVHGWLPDPDEPATQRALLACGSYNAAIEVILEAQDASRAPEPAQPQSDLIRQNSRGSMGKVALGNQAHSGQRDPAAKDSVKLGPTGRGSSGDGPPESLNVTDIGDSSPLPSGSSHTSLRGTPPVDTEIVATATPGTALSEANPAPGAPLPPPNSAIIRPDSAPVSEMSTRLSGLAVLAQPPAGSTMLASSAVSAAFAPSAKSEPLPSTGQCALTSASLQSAPHSTPTQLLKDSSNPPAGSTLSASVPLSADTTLSTPLAPKIPPDAANAPSSHAPSIDPTVSSLSIPRKELPRPPGSHIEQTTPVRPALTQTAPPGDAAARIADFLARHPGQMTPYGLQLLAKDPCTVPPDSYTALFRNNHFALLYKSPESPGSPSRLYTLVTDEGLGRQVVWETLTNVSGDESFLGAHFERLDTPAAAANDFGARQQTATLHMSDTLDPTDHQDRDLALALALQQEEEEQNEQAALDRARRRETPTRHPVRPQGSLIDIPVPTGTPPAASGSSSSVGAWRANLAAASAKPAPPPKSPSKGSLLGKKKDACTVM